MARLARRQTSSRIGWVRLPAARRRDVLDRAPMCHAGLSRKAGRLSYDGMALRRSLNGGAGPFGFRTGITSSLCQTNSSRFTKIPSLLLTHHPPTHSHTHHPPTHSHTHPPSYSQSARLIKWTTSCAAPAEVATNDNSNLDCNRCEPQCRRSNSWKAMAYASKLRGHINHCPDGQHVMKTCVIHDEPTC